MPSSNSRASSSPRPDLPSEPRLLEGLLPAPTLVAAAAIGAASPMDAWPEERAALGPAVEKRQIEFGRGRACARHALSCLGLEPQPILRDGRAPRWPEGIVGSISHCDTLVLVGVGRRCDLIGLGVDIEPCQRVPWDFAARIATPREARWLQQARDPTDSLTMLWCAKEAVFKCLYPAYGEFLEFTDVEVELSGDPRRFAVRELRRPRLAPLVPRLEGHLAIRWDHVLAACLLKP